MKEYKYKINGNLYHVTVKDVEEKIAHIEVNGTPYEVELDKPAPKMVSSTAPAIAAVKNSTPKSSAPTMTPVAPATNHKGSAVKSPLPGIIKDIKVNVGDTVKRGQVILILEAMKMENNINADKDGTISAVKVNKGDSVLEGTDLIIIE